MKKFYQYVLVILSIALLNISFHANAQNISCSSTGGSYFVNNSFSIPVDAPVGYMTDKAGNSTAAWDMKCIQDSSADRDVFVKLQTATAIAAGRPTVYPTNLYGWGIIYNFGANSGCSFPGDSHLTNGSFTWTCHLTQGTAQVDAVSLGASVQFVKLSADASPGMITSIPIVTASATFNNQAGITNLNNVWSGAANVAINYSSCTVNTAVVNVNLGNFLATEFTSVGHTTTTKDVPITLNCSAGIKVNALVTANNDTDTTQQGAIKLNTDSGSATGVAVQLLDKHSQGINLNQKFLVSTTTANGQISFGWLARYLQTKSIVTPGTANASATVMLTYE